MPSSWRCRELQLANSILTLIACTVHGSDIIQASVPLEPQIVLHIIRSMFVYSGCFLMVWDASICKAHPSIICVSVRTRTRGGWESNSRAPTVIPIRGSDPSCSAKASLFSSPSKKHAREAQQEPNQMPSSSRFRYERP